MAENDNTIEQKLTAARTRLILERPFLGALTLRLPLEEGDAAWCKTTATDAKKIYFNAEYVDTINLKQLQFMLAHNALHCALSHFNRRLGRDGHRWDIACDFAINTMLVEDGLVMPPDVLYLEKYSGMTAEEIYPFIEENSQKEPIDQHLYDETNQDSDLSPDSNDESDSQTEKSNPGKQNAGADYKLDNNQNGGKDSQGKTSAPKPLSQGEKEMLSTQWQQRLAGAAQQAMQAEKMSASMMKMVDFLLQPAVPWRGLLAHYLTARAREDYDLTRPSNRREGPAIFPSIHSKQITVVAVVDTSGSISDGEAQEFLTEISALKSQVRAKVTVVACDEKIMEEPLTYEPWDEISDFSHLTKAGRGTSFLPPFEWIEEQGIQTDLVVYFTDADGEFPDEPNYPVLWLVKGKAAVPWGQRIQLN